MYYHYFILYFEIGSLYHFCYNLSYFIRLILYYLINFSICLAKHNSVSFFLKITQSSVARRDRSIQNAKITLATEIALHTHKSRS